MWGSRIARSRPLRRWHRGGRGIHRRRAVVVLRMPPQRARVAVALAAALRLALVRFFVAMRQHVAVSGIENILRHCWILIDRHQKCVCRFWIMSFKLLLLCSRRTLSCALCYTCALPHFQQDIISLWVPSEEADGIIADTLNETGQSRHNPEKIMEWWPWESGSTLRNLIGPTWIYKKARRWKAVLRVPRFKIRQNQEWLHKR